MKSQIAFEIQKSKFEFGGSLLNRAQNRHARPVSSREPMHVILKSSQAVGRWSLGHSKHIRLIRKIIESACARYGVKLMQYSNNCSHLHMLLKFPSKAGYLRFIRAISCSIAMLVTGAKKNARLSKPFWDHRPYTRVLRGLRALQIVRRYIHLNSLEADGTIPYRKGRLRSLHPEEHHFFDHL